MDRSDWHRVVGEQLSLVVSSGCQRPSSSFLDLDYDDDQAQAEGDYDHDDDACWLPALIFFSEAKSSVVASDIQGWFGTWDLEDVSHWD